MANISFEYRSKRNPAKLSIRLTHKVNEEFISIRAQIDYAVEKNFWNEYKRGVIFRDADKANQKADLQEHLNSIEKYVLTAYKSANKVNSEWLKFTINNFYNPEEPNIVPTLLLDYFDYYLNQREYELKQNIANWKKFRSIRNLVEKFQLSTGRDFSIIDIDEKFVKLWTEYGQKNNYKASTIKKSFNLIKTVVKHAKMRSKIEVNPEFDSFQIKVKSADLPKIWLTFDELDKIGALTGLPDNLENARDWLIVSCYTGQRISDFMRFNSRMIRKVNGTSFIDFKQIKTGTEITVPVLPEVQIILDKKNGEFPKRIIDQKYNKYIKEVCKLAGIDEKMKGKLTKVLKGGEIRAVTGIYKKYELISSHVGRRSFATNYYGKVSTSYIKNITGHSTETMLLQYIGKTSVDTAQEAYEALLNAK